MDLSDVVHREAIVPQLSADTRDEALIELVEVLVDRGILTPELQDETVIAFLKRESFGTTALGNGVAIPHIKVEHLKQFVGALGISRDGIDFAAPDRKPVNVILLFLSPERSAREHLQLLARIGGILSNSAFVKLLLHARTKAELHKLLQDEAQLRADGGEPGQWRREGSGAEGETETDL